MGNTPITPPTAVRALQIAEFVARKAETRRYVEAYENSANDPKEVRRRYEQWLAVEIEAMLTASPQK